MQTEKQSCSKRGNHYCIKRLKENVRHEFLFMYLYQTIIIRNSRTRHVT